MISRYMLTLVFLLSILALFNGFQSPIQRISWMNLRQTKHECDVCVLGGGPAGMAISWLLQEQQKCKVILVDPKGNLEKTWYPNYGEWRDEWHTISERLRLPEIKECTTTEWEKTDCFFGGSYDLLMDHRLTLPRPYVRVDRVKLQKLFRSRFLAADGQIVASKVNARQISHNIFDQGISHHGKGTTLSLENNDVIESRVVIDATGFETQLTAKEEPHVAGRSKTLPLGYQIAYGFIATVDHLGPYDFNAMTLFDYRTDHIKDDKWLKDVENRPTFMYVMPLSKNSDGTYRVFWEETSLVGKGDRLLSFEECKKRAYERFKHYNIRVLGVEEEEYCYIPMGGELPDSRQRIVSFGGAANMVHPATGYHVCRMLAASADLASTIGQGVKQQLSPDAIAANSYRTMWNQQNRGQRDFQAYGGDFLMAQNVKRLRGFFQAFFALEQIVWSGFLAGWPGLPGNNYHETWYKRITFALQEFMKMPNDVRLTMTLYAIKHTIEFGPNTLLRSLMPEFVFGRGPPDPFYSDRIPSNQQGELSRKEEAKRMMREFQPYNEVQQGIEHESVLTHGYPAPYDRE